MGFIYKITNDINGKVYIGKTDFTVEERWKAHQYDWKSPRVEKRPLYDAFTKYGIQHFHIETIEEANTDILPEREQYWINYYRSYVGFVDCNGYNATLGGDGKAYFNHSDEEVIQKYNELGTVRKVASFYGCREETISVRLHRNGIDPNQHRKRQLNGGGKQVIALDILTGELIQTFASQSEAARWLIDQGLANGSVDTVGTNIGRCCRGIRHTCSGYRWQYAQA